MLKNSTPCRVFFVYASEVLSGMTILTRKSGEYLKYYTIRYQPPVWGENRAESIVKKLS